MEMENTWNVEVWFATSSGYRTVCKGLSRNKAMEEARQYDSDSRGVRITRLRTGAVGQDVVVVKAEALR